MRLSFTATVFCAAALFAGGCMDTTTDVYVKKDGSGTVTQTMFMSEATLGMMKQMQAAMGGGEATPDPMKIDTKKKAELQKKAATMGAGVKLVSAENIKNDAGKTGQKIVFSFTDINLLRLNSEIEAPTIPGQPKQETKTSPITFTFKPGATKVLTIKQPQPKTTPELSPEENAKDMPAPQKIPPEQLAQMKQMFSGLKLWIRVRVEGNISTTNASHVNKKKDGVSLIKIEFDKLLEDEKAFEKVLGMGKIKSVEEARQKLKAIPGIQFEPEQEVTVEF